MIRAIAYFTRGMLTVGTFTYSIDL